MLVTDNEKLADRCKSIRNLCFQREKRYYHEELSGNYRFTNLQAAVGLAQLERLDEFVEKKRHIGKMYTDALSGIDGLQLPLTKTDYADNIYWVYGIVLDEKIGIDNRKKQKRLAEKEIETRTFFWCMHEQPVLKNMGLFNNEIYHNAERLARKGLYVPSGLALSDKQIYEVCEALKSCCFTLNEQA